MEGTAPGSARRADLARERLAHWRRVKAEYARVPRITLDDEREWQSILTHERELEEGLLAAEAEATAGAPPSLG